MPMNGLGWRLFAIVYAWTIGLLIGLAIIVAATIYAVVDIVNALAGNGTFWQEFTLFLAISESLKWQYNLHQYAFLGAGPGFDPAPDVDF